MIVWTGCWAKAWPAKSAFGYWVQHGEQREAVKLFPYNVTKEVPSPFPAVVWLWLDECHKYRPCNPPERWPSSASINKGILSYVTDA